MERLAAADERHAVETERKKDREDAERKQKQVFMHCGDCVLGPKGKMYRCRFLPKASTFHSSVSEGFPQSKAMPATPPRFLVADVCRVACHVHPREGHLLGPGTRPPPPPFGPSGPT